MAGATSAQAFKNNISIRDGRLQCANITPQQKEQAEAELSFARAKLRYAT